jgi:hypothetical protein
MFKLFLISFFIPFLISGVRTVSKKKPKIIEIDRELIPQEELIRLCNNPTTELKNKISLKILIDTSFSKDEVERVKAQVSMCSFMNNQKMNISDNKTYKNKKVTCDSNAQELTESIKKFENDIDQTNIYLGMIKSQVESSLTPQISLTKILEFKEKLKGNRDNFKYCLFQKHIASELQLVGNSIENKNFLEILSSAGHCLSVNPEIDGGAFSNMFESIYDLFSKKDELKDEDCEVLQRTFELWASFNQKQNKRPSLGSSVPVYNVNRHDTAYHKWSEQRIKDGDWPEDGLTLFHVDTHTDMGPIHEHGVKGRILSTLKLKDITDLSLIKDDKKLIERTQALLKSGGGTSKKQKVYIKKGGLEASVIRGKLRAQIESRIHHIATPVTAAVHSGVSDKINLGLPSWSKRVVRTRASGGNPESLPMQTCTDKSGNIFPMIRLNNPELQKGQKYRLSLDFVARGCDSHPKKEDKLVCLEKIHKAAPKYFPKNPNKQLEKMQLAIDRPFYIVKDESICSKTSQNFPLNVLNINTEKKDQDGRITNDPKTMTNFAPFFKDKEKEEGFILDIDLDAFVSEPMSWGEKNEENVTPASYKRTQHGESSSHMREMGVHPGADRLSNETDSRPFVSSTEMKLIDERINSFFDNLQKTGAIPKVITIADSTQLTGLNIENDTQKYAQGGGGFTPKCLAFLVNYKVKLKLKELYNTEFVTD